MALLENLGIILIGFIAVVSAFLIILALIEKKLRQKYLGQQYARNQFYIEKLSKLNVNTPKESLQKLEKLGKDFFKEAFHVKGNPDYSELAHYFSKKNNRKATHLSTEIVRLMYSKDEITKEKLQEFITLLAEIISSNKIISKERRKELDRLSLKKSQDKTTLLDKVKKKL